MAETIESAEVSPGTWWFSRDQWWLKWWLGCAVANVSPWAPFYHDIEIKVTIQNVPKMFKKNRQGQVPNHATIFRVRNYPMLSPSFTCNGFQYGDAPTFKQVHNPNISEYYHSAVGSSARTIIIHHQISHCHMVPTFLLWDSHYIVITLW